MGGETLLTGRFEDLIDTMIDNKTFSYNVKKIDLKEIVESIKSRA